jgi:hypothetical protein
VPIIDIEEFNVGIAEPVLSEGANANVEEETKDSPKE